MATRGKKNEVVEFISFDIRNIEVELQGESPLIMHRWSEKAVRMMLDKQMKKTSSGKKEAKDPNADYESSIYKFSDNRLGFPADAFKASMVRGAKQLGLTMTDMRTGFFVHGEFNEADDRELVPIQGTVSPRQDMVRLNGGVADIRYRGQVINWSAKIHISYNAHIVSADQIVNMLSAAGYGVGVGEWRPEKNGSFGRFKVNQNSLVSLDV